MAVLIDENDALAEAVTQQMLNAGVPIREPGKYFVKPS